MPDQVQPSGEGSRQPDREEGGTVVLPISKQEFGRFLSGLLGKPQTIEKTFHGCFEINVQDVENTFHLVDQRVRQQNEAHLVQFTATVQYDDNSSVLLNSLPDFLHYKEVRPLVSEAVHMTWTYMIRFQDKGTPEKQEIQLSFMSTPRRNMSHYLSGVDYMSHVPQYAYVADIYLRISHTARTWGVDMESLLTGHVRSFLKEDSRLKRFLWRHDGSIGFTVGALVVISCLVGAYITSGRVVLARQSAAARLLELDEDTASAMAERVSFLIQDAVSGIWPRFALAMGLFVLLALAGSIALGIWVGTMASNEPSSFVLLSDRAIKMRDKYLARRTRRWWLFAVSLVTSAVGGVIANLLFDTLFRRWL